MKQGEIYWAEFQDAGTRPVIVVARDELNHGNHLLIVPLTSMHVERRSRLPNCVPFNSGQFGLDRACVAQCELASVIPLNKIDFDSGFIGRLDDEHQRNLIRAMGHVLDAECEPA